ncbi:MAG: phosphocholine cytidylyltransferase family protein [Alphaproteobacteria bacterium]|nr:phosphocholine cytidylyltransferase family protein [Alphaproteobacteria bacterium]MBU2380398.1 phosphocholine cytidylyltransferase family protein [Alphaproteobacteria bacterium]
MTGIKRAIVLSAGQGRRLLPLTETRPKCLIELGERSLLAWQLMHLEAAGVAETLVVTGFGANLVEQEIERLSLATMTVTTLYNPFYGVADNLASCWIAREAFEGDVLLLNGDTLFERAIAERLIAAPAAGIVVTIDRKGGYDADDMKVETRGDALVAIGKTITTFDAESIGFLRFSAEGSARFRVAIDAALRDSENLRRWYLSIIDELAREGGVAVCSIEGLQWGEMDFIADLTSNDAMVQGWLAGG